MEIAAFALLCAKKTAILVALVDPFAAVPIFLAASSAMLHPEARAFAARLGVTVAAALVCGGLFGAGLLQLFGVSIPAMQAAGGAIGLILAIAIVLGQEQKVKGSEDVAERAMASTQVVPLGIPLLAGPATLSFMMANSKTSSAWEVGAVVIPSLLVGVVVFAAFAAGLRVGRRIPGTVLSVVERLAGFLLAAISVEMIAAGVRGLFPSIL